MSSFSQPQEFFKIISHRCLCFSRFLLHRSSATNCKLELAESPKTLNPAQLSINLISLIEGVLLCGDGGVGQLADVFCVIYHAEGELSCGLMADVWIEIEAKQGLVKLVVCQHVEERRGCLQIADRGKRQPLHKEVQFSSLHTL